MENDTYILAIESSCDDTSAAVLKNRSVLSNVTANQSVHEAYGGVVPELASRAHQKNIVPVVDQALKIANIVPNQLDAVAFTSGPGLLGSLLVGVSFSKSLHTALNIPMIEVHHMQAHILAHLIENDGEKSPDFPFLCLTVSGGHTQIVKVSDPYTFEVVGETIDDAAGEAFDKVAKIMGLPYPGGPVIDKLAKEGNPEFLTFNKPKIEGLDFSFSGLKTSFLYTLQKEVKADPDFVEKNKADICASIQKTIVDILIQKLTKAAKAHNIAEIALAGGVSANSELRARLLEAADKNQWKAYIPPFEYTTDNAAMIGITGYFKFLREDFAPSTLTAKARVSI